MGSTPSSIDTHTLAAFIAGTLDDDRRRAVIEHLARHPDDREWLQMALDARAAAQELDAEAAPLPERPAVPNTRGAAARPAKRRSRSRHWLLGALATVVLLAGLSIVLAPPSDTIRAIQTAEAPLSVAVDAAPLAFQWEAVADAYSYRVVIWDPEAAAVVDETSTREPSLAADAAFVTALRPQLEPGRTYQVRVDAIDAQNRRIRSSEATSFTAPGS